MTYQAFSLQLLLFVSALNDAFLYFFFEGGPSPSASMVLWLTVGNRFLSCSVFFPTFRSFTVSFICDKMFSLPQFCRTACFKKIGRFIYLPLTTKEFNIMLVNQKESNSRYCFTQNFFVKSKAVVCFYS